MSLDVSLGPWVADNCTSQCQSCGASFHLFRRRHHCRCCGGIFCSSCTSQVCTIPTYPSLIPQRVCRECHVMLSTRESGRCQMRDRALLRPQHNQPVLTTAGPGAPPVAARGQQDEGAGPTEPSTDDMNKPTSPLETPGISDANNSGVRNDPATSGDKEDEEAVSTAVAGALS
ncbi:FYVE_zinc_finger_containing_protein_putative [Leishmania major strain Friedlin]|nr:FYVE_zinc_finger_containing_protein_putative [Leishmania major strain Friedlin]